MLGSLVAALVGDPLAPPAKRANIALADTKKRQQDEATLTSLDKGERAFLQSPDGHRRASARKQSARKNSSRKIIGSSRRPAGSARRLAASPSARRPAAERPAAAPAEHRTAASPARAPATPSARRPAADRPTSPEKTATPARPAASPVATPVRPAAGPSARRPAAERPVAAERVAAPVQLMPRVPAAQSRQGRGESGASRAFTVPTTGVRVATARKQAASGERPRGGVGRSPPYPHSQQHAQQARQLERMAELRQLDKLRQQRVRRAAQRVAVHHGALAHRAMPDQSDPGQPQRQAPSPPHQRGIEHAGHRLAAGAADLSQGQPPQPQYQRPQLPRQPPPPPQRHSHGQGNAAAASAGAGSGGGGTDVSGGGIGTSQPLPLARVGPQGAQPHRFLSLGMRSLPSDGVPDEMLSDDMLVARQLSTMEPRLAAELLLARQQLPVREREQLYGTAPEQPAPIIMPGMVRSWNQEMATWHSRMDSPSFAPSKALPGEPLSVTFAGAQAQAIYQPSADELRDALGRAESGRIDDGGTASSDCTPTNGAAAGNDAQSGTTAAGPEPGSPPSAAATGTGDPLPEALRDDRTTDAWHDTIRQCSAAQLGTCLQRFGVREPHLALDCFAQVRLRCVQKKQRQLIDAGMANGVRAAMKAHTNVLAVQKLGYEVLALLGRSSRSQGQLGGDRSTPYSKYSIAASRGGSIFDRYARQQLQRHQATLPTGGHPNAVAQEILAC